MVDSVTLYSTEADGTKYQITLNKTGTDTGSLDVKSFDKDDKPLKDESFELYNILAAADGASLGCYAKVFGADPWVTFEIKDNDITVTVNGAWASNGVTNYNLDNVNVLAILAFIKECAFPVAK